MTLAVIIFLSIAVPSLAYAIWNASTAKGPFIQHHFDDATHQFESGKLGIWLFLGQEILFFSALFVAYIIYRHNHPEVFAYAHKYLDVQMGAINTAVLILSSLTAAWAVRAAQLGQKRLLVGLIIVTLLCACAFLVVKYFEYSHKVHVGTVFGKRFAPHETPDGKAMPHPEEKPEAVPPGAQAPASPASGQAQPPPAGGAPVPGAAVATSAPSVGPDKAGGHGGEGVLPPPNTGMFFTIYFAMTGLHGIHVLAGIIVFIWLLIRAIRGHFGPTYYGPIDFAALYWHLVDLIWIFLFPMLYLIH